MDMHGANIRLLSDNTELQQVVHLQQVYWGEDADALVPLHMLASIVNYGGHVFGAIIDKQLVGVLIGFLGADIDPDSTANAAQRLLVMSKRMVVLPEMRGRGIGEMLKLAQRDYALKHGIQLVTWTFDPLLARNAYLNLHKLAAIGQAYQPDYFGSAAIHPTLRADRLVVKWWVNHPITSQRIEGSWDFCVRDATPVVNPPRLGRDNILIPADSWSLQQDEETVLLEIPLEFVPIETLDTGLAQAWRDQIRDVFSTLLPAGYVALDVIRRDWRVYYVLSRAYTSFDFI